MEIIQGGPGHVDVAALIWAHGVTVRDGHDRVPTLEEARPGIENALANEPSLLLLAVEGGEAVGFLAGGPQGTGPQGTVTAYINYVGVHPDAWGKRIGEALLRALPEALKARGYTDAELLVYVDNERGVRLYERLGWIKVGDPAPHRRNGRLEQRYSFSATHRTAGVRAGG